MTISDAGRSPRRSLRRSARAPATSCSGQNISNKAQAPGNVAGVIFHPNGDCFEIWDNVKNSISVRVSWNYHGIRDRVKKVFSRGRHSMRCVDMREFPHQINFRISGLDPTAGCRSPGSALPHVRQLKEVSGAAAGSPAA